MPKLEIKLEEVRLEARFAHEVRSLFLPYSRQIAELGIVPTPPRLEFQTQPITPADYEELSRNPFWAAWRVKGTNGIEEESSYREISHELPDSVIEQLDGSRDCRMRLLGGLDLYNKTQPVLSLAFVLRDGKGSVTVSAPKELLSELADDVRELMSEYTLTPDSKTDAAAAQPFKIFIAYGGGRAWEVVRDYLRDAGFDVDAFTEQERLSEMTLDVVERMIRGASAAIIVMTGTDKMADGELRARQNVVHETGFAQGALGRANTFVLREEGVALPTNISGLNYLQFPRGEIHTTKDRVVDLMKARQTATS